MEIIIGLIVFAVVVGIISGSRNRNGFGWFFLSIAISPILALILVLALPGLPPRRNPYAPLPTPDTKICPRCAETIKTAAIACRYCGYELEGAKEKSVRTPIYAVSSGSPRRP